MSTQKQIRLQNYRAEGFIGKYQKLVRETVIPYQYSVLWDKAPDAEKSHVAANFINAAAALEGRDTGDGFYGMVFQDSDAAKWLEAAAYALIGKRSEELEKNADELIDLIAAAQDKDGYLNTYFTVKDTEKRWTNLLEGHELYCAGHLIEAACAYYEATGKRALLDTGIRNMEHIYKRFVIDGAEGVPGHPEIELALMRLYHLTGDKRALELCERFINERGQDPSFYAREAEKRDWTVWNGDPWDNDYRQSGKPVRLQSDATGHAVRAVYLYTGMADLAAETGDNELLAACRRLWESITKRRMYVTGGIGSTVLGEAFSVDYDLPSDTAYCETCASIGLMFFASQMLCSEISGEYADVMERAFYNTVLAGMQLDGKRFFYVNPLEVNVGISGVTPTQRHDLPSRPGWYACACCPPNVARLIGSIGRYAYGEKESTAFCHLFAAGEVSFENGLSLSCETGYPYDMTVTYEVTGCGTLAIRIPGWSKSYKLTLNAEALDASPVKGYVYVDVHDGDTLQLVLDGTPSFIRASSKIPSLSGKAALRRGPLVYCFEGCDNGDIPALRLDTSKIPTADSCDENLPAGTVTLTAHGWRVPDFDGLYTEEEAAPESCTLTAVPYYTWGNRGENSMRVWLDTYK